MVSKKLFKLTAMTVLLFNCSQKEHNKIITVKNTLDMERSFETVELSREQLGMEHLDGIGIKDTKAGQLQITQTVDNDGDGNDDVILFQPQIPANSENQYEVVKIKEAERPKADTLCYSRFVPERIDDYAWENDRVAFRAYGPKAQKMIEDGDPNGTLSSGVDAWLKRVSYRIINKWYKKASDGTGTYHKDTGEGLDNFHVGASRGVGGIAVKVDSAYYCSKNFIKWRTIATGPIRTSFYLEYADWDAAGRTIKESRVMSLDRGSNLTKFTIAIKGMGTVSAGLTLHQKNGDVSGNKENGWVSYWEPLQDSEIGTGIVADKNTFMDYETYDTEAQDLSNVYAKLKVTDGSVSYYAGFGWKKSGQFNSEREWETYLGGFSKKINNPLVISIK